MVRFPLLFLILLTAFGFPRGTEAQGVFEITPDTLLFTEPPGEVVVRNVSPEGIALDSMSMRFPDPDFSVHGWHILASGQPTSGEVEDYTFVSFEDTSHTQEVDLTFAPNDTLLLSFHIDSCIPCFESAYGDLQVDTLVFHSNGLVATDTLIVDWAGLVDNEETPTNPSEINLRVHPNPSPSLVQINLALDTASEISVAVLDIRGKQVAELEHGSLSAGKHTFTWDGSGVAPGVYVIHVETENAVTSQTATITY